MGDGFQFLDIIFFAAVAAFLVLRLRSVLGKRTGNEKERDPYALRRGEEQEKKGDNVVRMPRRDESEEEPVEPDSTAGHHAGVTQIRVADPSFAPDQFLGGAEQAFGMVIDAFARGDRETLRGLLSDQAYTDFESAITEREENGQDLETTVEEMSDARIDEAGMEGSEAWVTVRFVTQQRNVLKDSEGHVLEGNPVEAEEVVDLWTFARDTRSDDPNWFLVATRSPE